MLAQYWDAISAAYDLGAVVTEPVIAARGEQGRIWRLDTDRGSFAAKVLIVHHDEVDAAEDVAYQEAIIAAGSSLRLPRPIRTRQGAVLSEFGRHQARIYEWIELRPADRDQDPQLIGATYAAIHRVHHHTQRPLLGWYTDPVGSPRWASLLEVSRAIGAPFAEALAAEIPFLVELENLVEIPTGLQMCHRDLWADNLPPGDAGGVWVIDWENCGLASPTHELPMALVDFCDGNQERTSTLYAAYVEAGGPARLRRPGDFTMVIAQFGHFWEKAVTAYLDPAAPAEQRAHSIERIVELTNAPLRIEQIHAVLDWTAHAN